MSLSRPGARELVLSLFVLVFSSFASYVRAETWNGTPLESDLIFGRTDELDVAWSTNFPESNLALRCQGMDESAFSKEFTMGVPGTGSYTFDLSEYGEKAPRCYFEVIDAATGSPGLESPYFYINNIESDPPRIWHFSDKMTPASVSSSLLAFLSAPLKFYPTSNVMKDLGSIWKRTTQSDTSSPESSSLSSATIIGISVGVGIVVITLLATFWYILRSNRISDMERLEDEAALKAAELETARAASETEITKPGPKNFSYPVSIGENKALPPMQRVEHRRPSWIRPFYWQERSASDE